MVNGREEFVSSAKVIAFTFFVHHSSDTGSAPCGTDRIAAAVDTGSEDVEDAPDGVTDGAAAFDSDGEGSSDSGGDGSAVAASDCDSMDEEGVGFDAYLAGFTSARWLQHCMHLCTMQSLRWRTRAL